MYGATSSVHHITNGAGGYMFVVTKHNLPDTGKSALDEQACIATDFLL